METANNYDEALKKAEQIIARLEQAEAISLDEYKRLSAEATTLLKQCQSEIEGMEIAAPSGDMA